MPIYSHLYLYVFNEVKLYERPDSIYTGSYHGNPRQIVDYGYEFSVQYL